LVKHRWAISFLLPALSFYVFVVVYPSFQGLKFAFTDWSGFTQGYNWTGLRQFERVLEDPDTRGALWHTFIIAIGVTIFQNLLGLLLALGLFSKVKSRNLLRTLFFAPAVVAPVATSYLWQYMYAPSGPINSFLQIVGLKSLVKDWLGDPSIVLNSIIVVIIWQFAGYSMVIFLAGLEGVPKELIEAAAIDGANYLQRFWFVIRQFLYPAITVTLMLSIVGGFKLFDQVFILTGGGPGQASQTISTMMYRNAFLFGEFAFSTALAVLLTILVSIFSAIQYFLITKIDKS
jgi:raffinose/stachyose/melibiose transport system permease protein